MLLVEARYKRLQAPALSALKERAATCAPTRLERHPSRGFPHAARPNTGEFTKTQGSSRQIGECAKEFLQTVQTAPLGDGDEAIVTPRSSEWAHRPSGVWAVGRCGRPAVPVLVDRRWGVRWWTSQGSRKILCTEQVSAPRLHLKNSKNMKRNLRRNSRHMIVIERSFLCASMIPC